MTISIEKIFPAEQCLPEEHMMLVEEITGRDIRAFFAGFGPMNYDGTTKHTHIEEPFIQTFEDAQVKQFSYYALTVFAEQMLQIRQKLIQDQS